MTTGPEDYELEADLLADPNAAGDPAPLDGRDGQPAPGSSDDPQDWQLDGRGADDLRSAESDAMHVIGEDGRALDADADLPASDAADSSEQI